MITKFKKRHALVPKILKKNYLTRLINKNYKTKTPLNYNELVDRFNIKVKKDS